MQNQNFKDIKTTFVDSDREEGKYTELYTDVGTFTIQMTFEELKAELDKGGIFRNRALIEYSQVVEHFAELILDLDKVKILGFREHHIIDDLKLTRELRETPESTN